jgi:hypothetical protein
MRMRLADLPKGRSRRQERREKEETGMLGPAQGRNVLAKKKYKPAKLESGQIRQPLVPIQPNALNETKVDWLPGQKQLLKTSIRPQRQVEIVVADNQSTDGLDTRHSIIQEINPKGKTLYLSQTAPPFLPSSIGRVLDLSFLGRYFDIPGGRWLRVGYKAKLLKIIKDYPARPDWSEDVIVVPAPKKLQPSSLRLAYRVSPPPDLDLRLAVWPNGTPLGIMDLSAGGAQFYHDSQMYWPKGQHISLILVSGEFKVVLGAKVVRNAKIKDIYGRDKGVTSVTYVDLEPTVRHKYADFLVEVYRHALAQRSGVE